MRRNQKQPLQYIAGELSDIQAIAEGLHCDLLAYLVAVARDETDRLISGAPPEQKTEPDLMTQRLAALMREAVRQDGA